MLGRILTAYYFLFFLVVMPVVGWIEKPKALPGSITESVLGPQETPAAAAKASASPPRAGAGGMSDTSVNWPPRSLRALLLRCDASSAVRG